ncbi:MAG: hypothetical protein HY059_18615 [Proteobacteria bacterium]|nr:hypothetical protein [Pseudomonadota bacterium]
MSVEDASPGLIQFLRAEKKYWLVPIAVCAALLIAILALAKIAPMRTPFVYTIF